MRKILVPLDGSVAAEQVVTDAIRLAGTGGEIVLIHDVVRPGRSESEFLSPEAQAVESSEAYLEERKRLVTAAGVKVTAETFVLDDPVRAIDDAAKMFGVDLIACATHGRTGLRRMLQPSIAWAALAHSPVPVMIKRAGESAVAAAPQAVEAKILVPLDGSPLAERAIPLAVELAREWNAPLLFARILLFADDLEDGNRQDGHLEQEQREAKAYLQGLADKAETAAAVTVVTGAVVSRLIEVVANQQISHVVMASHGRTGVGRFVLGSVADDLIQHLRIPILVIPAFAGVPSPETDRTRELVAV